jgi:hypothetical protein
MLVAGFSQFNKDTSFLLRAAATANLGQRRYWFRARPRGLVSLWAALDSSRLWRVLGRPLDPPGRQALFGMSPGGLTAGGDVAHSALKPGI